MKKTVLRVVVPLVCAWVVVCATGCYSLRKSKGGAQAEFKGPRVVNAGDVVVPEGYRVEVVAQGLTFPTGVTFDGEGRPYVVEAGYAYGEVWTTPRLLRIEADGRMVPIASGGTNGPWTGVFYHEGAFYVAEGGELEGGRILRIEMNGTSTVLASNLPSMGDHHCNGPVVAPDGWLYFGIGTASNSGVVGEDNAKFGWLFRKPEFHDIPGQDVRLAGQVFESRNPLKGGKEKAQTGGYLPFGTAGSVGQRIQGRVPCTGAIMRLHTEIRQMELVAWGLRNPFGLAFAPDGRLFVTENGYDDRGSRPVWGAPDVLWEVRKGSWYGWPDFSAGMPLTMDRFKPPGKAQPKFLLAEHPGTPPKPAALFGVHASANGLDFSRNAAFGHVGQAFVALFGDQAPAVGKVLHPVGFKVVRVDVASGAIESFAWNRGKSDGPASWLGTGGLERPIAARFNPAGDSLYVVDFGVLTESKKGSNPRTKTGVLWRITPSR